MVLRSVAADEQESITAEAEAVLRVHLATRQRILAQQIAKSTCFTMSHFNADQNAEYAWDAAEEFGQNAKVLMKGGGNGPLKEESHPEILHRLEKTRGIWATYGAAARQVVSGDRHAVVIAQLLRLDVPLMDEVDHSVSDIARIHREAMVTGRARTTTVNVAGRQAMLIQKAAKEMCYIHLGIAEDQMRANLAETIEVFESAMQALEFGDYDQEVIDPPSLAFLIKISELRDQWAAFREPIQRVVEGPSPTEADMAQIEELNMEMTQIASTLSALYLE